MEPVCSPVWKVFATMVNSNRRAQREIYEDLVGRHDYPFLTTCVSASSVVDNALESGSKKDLSDVLLKIKAAGYLKCRDKLVLVIY